MPSQLPKNLLDNGLVWRARGARLCAPTATYATAQFGVEEIDQQLPHGGLPFGHIHEWTLEAVEQQSRRRQWFAPIFLISALLGKVLSENATTKKYIAVWIGKHCWPSPQVLQQVSQPFHENKTGWNWRATSIFLNPPCKQTRAWSICETLQSDAVIAVIADGSGFDTTVLRRFQLAAKRGKTLGLISKPPWEQDTPSTAYSRWHVTPLVTSNVSSQFAWQLTLKRIRGTLRSSTACPVSWHIEWSDEHSLSVLNAYRVNHASAFSGVHTASTAVPSKTSISSVA